jgi:Ca-activated chloride channel family protein
MAPMPVGKNPFTGETVYRNEPADVDEDTLQKIAQMDGGKYYRADDAAHFRQIYAEIDKQEKTEAVINKFTEYSELFPWFVGGGFGLLLCEILLAQTILRRLP